MSNWKYGIVTNFLSAKYDYILSTQEKGFNS